MLNSVGQQFHIFPSIFQHFVTQGSADCSADQSPTSKYEGCELPNLQPPTYKKQPLMSHLPSSSMNSTKNKKIFFIFRFILNMACYFLIDTIWTAHKYTEVVQKSHVYSFVLIAVLQQTTNLYQCLICSMPVNLLHNQYLAYERTHTHAVSRLEEILTHSKRNPGTHVTDFHFIRWLSHYTANQVLPITALLGVFNYRGILTMPADGWILCLLLKSH